MQTDRQKLWESYMNEHMPGWASDWKVAIIFLIAVIPSIFGLATRSFWIAVVGIFGLLICLAYMKRRCDQLSWHLSNFNKEFPE